MDIYARNISDKGKEYAEAVEAAFPGLLPEAGEEKESVQ